MATPKKNYIDEKGNYHNIENLTLTQIYDRGVEEGYRIAKQEIEEAKNDTVSGNDTSESENKEE